MIDALSAKRIHDADYFYPIGSRTVIDSVREGLIMACLGVQTPLN